MKRREDPLVSALTAMMVKTSKNEGFSSSKELAKQMGVSRRLMAELLDTLFDQGRLERRRVLKLSYDGIHHPTSVFRIRASSSRRSK